jgi:hypothetical protein
LVLGLWDGKRFVSLDFSLRNESEKKKNRGLKSNQLKLQHSNDRPNDRPGQQRIDEGAVSKIAIVTQMIRRAIKNGLRVEYILADSWFISEIHKEYLGNWISKQGNAQHYRIDENKSNSAYREQNSQNKHTAGHLPQINKEM